MAASGAAATSSRLWPWARKAVLLGRGHAYGLAAGGEKGVARALSIFHSDLVRTMRLLGRASVAELDESVLQRR